MQAAAEALVMTDCLPVLMLKRTGRRDEECYDVMSTALFTRSNVKKIDYAACGESRNMLRCSELPRRRRV